MASSGLPGRSLDEFFAGHEESRRIFEAVRVAVESIGSADARVTKSQVAFWRRRPFAWVWMPEQYLRRPCAPLVLTLARSEPSPSPRFKKVVEPAPGRFTHHLELYAESEVDEEVRRWLREAWETAE